MPSLTEGRLTFHFPHGSQPQKLDDWSFYANQFRKLGNGIRVPCGHCRAELRCQHCGTNKTMGIKSVDFLFLDARGNGWLIEVKDYRTEPRTKTIDLADEIALKVRDSLALLAVAGRNANDEDEKRLALASLSAERIRIVLHLEQSEIHSKLFPRPINPADVQQRLRQLVRSVDPHPLVADRSRGGSLAWPVSCEDRER